MTGELGQLALCLALALSLVEAATGLIGAQPAGPVARGIASGVANAVLVKLNQNGTLSGTLDVIAMARAHGYATIVSARSGETEDAFMSDLAVGAGAWQIKIGSLRTSSTVAKYSQLLRIAETSNAPYAGVQAMRRQPRVP